MSPNSGGCGSGCATGIALLVVILGISSIMNRCHPPEPPAVRLQAEPTAAALPTVPTGTPPATAVASASPTLKPTTTARAITHENAEMLTGSDASAHQKRVGKLALQIENTVKWSSDSDLAKAGKADGEAALVAFHEAATTPAAPPRKGKKPHAQATEDPDALKDHVKNIVLLDASQAWFENQESYRAYREAFESTFDLDEQTEAGEEPHPSVWDRHIDIVDDYIKGQIDNPVSYRFVECWKPMLTKVNGQWSWQVKYVFRSKNSFGGVVKETAFVTLRGGHVVGFELQKP